MRYFLTMLFAMLFATSAMATDLSVDVGTRKDAGVTGQFSRVTETRVQDGALGVQVTAGTVARVETDYSIAVPYVSGLTVAAGLGAVTSATGHYTYSISPKLTVPVTDKVAAFASFKYRDAFKSNLVSDKTEVSDIGVSYAVYKNVAVTAKLEHSTGDQRYNAGLVGAAYTF